MKKVGKNIKMIMGIVIGVIISGVTSYAVAATLINSKDVVYQDNMSIGATNVQNAIDGTCSKIDTRLSAIEDNLYTIKSFNKEASISGTINYSYTGVSIDVPAKSYCTITAVAVWSNSAPSRVGIDNINSVDNVQLSVSHQDTTVNPGALSTTYSGYNENATTYYIFAQYGANKAELIVYNGFCATKV